jgi:hypothetical protein
VSIFSNPAGGARATAGEYIAALLDLLGNRNPLEVQAELSGSLRELTAGLSVDELFRPEAPGK